MHIPAEKKMVEGGGFEPPKASPTDLQSVPFDHSGTPPHIKKQKTKAVRDSRSPSLFAHWSWRWDLNPQPPDYKSGALPIELRQLKQTLENIAQFLARVNFFFYPY
jgi:hypothetical protein